MDTTTTLLLVVLAVFVVAYVMKRRVRLSKDDVD
jgi:hypothetical protein